MIEKRRDGALYFLALVPPEPVQEMVRALQQEMAERHGARHAMRSPPHITLQMPFRMPHEQEDPLAGLLGPLCRETAPFTLELDGFGCFEPRVIYLKVSPHEPVVHLHARLRESLAHHTRLHPAAITQHVHPHMTIATRDLKKREFGAAWPAYENRPFHTTFTADGLTLLKHLGNLWQPYRTFGFEGAANQAGT